jgi:hypothetical protein
MERGTNGIQTPLIAPELQHLVDEPGLDDRESQAKLGAHTKAQHTVDRGKYSELNNTKEC